MKLFVVLAALAICASAANQPKVKVGSICSECQYITKKIVEISKNPSETAILKSIFLEFCQKTSYKEQCKAIVNDFKMVIQLISPYLDNAKKFCKSIDLCSSQRLAQIRKMNMVYGTVPTVKGEMTCEECQFLTTWLRGEMDKKETQAKARRELDEKVCSQMGALKNNCNYVVEEFVSAIFSELHYLFSEPKEMCVDVGICKSSAVSKLSSRDTPEKKLLRDLFDMFHKQ
ncbi:hypothetical protein L596_007613 [Steinernema carpocapsae]|uniref:Saposin B-type domain-containing protein n=1 Tax=Steinernema carpocapsae TaxID=34508 RepID=A0A4U5P9V5_STECR|nr:hypothetical protein L596_007613 [Steinernema carpocapsae]